MKQKLLISVSTLFLAAGIIIMLYPAVSSYVNAGSQSRVIDRYEETVEGFPDQKIEKLREEAEKYNTRISKSSVVMTDPFDESAVRTTSEAYEETLNVDGVGMMAFLDIEEIDVHLPVYHGTGETVLARAVGHLQGTSLPVGGADTHTVLSAHTGLAEAKLFTDLDELEEGDTFRIIALDEELTYEIYDIEVVEPEDISSLKIEKGRDLCTLVTCTPYGVNSHRLLVHGERAFPTDDIQEENTTQDSSMLPSKYLLAGIGALLIVLLLLTVIVRRLKIRKRRHELWQSIRGR